jgi:hypothetical protein
MVRVFCVLKSGGDFDVDDVYNLMRHVDNNTTVEYKFECLSDVPEVATIPLTDNLKGWWSKLELFRYTGPSVFLDLDTAIFGNIDSLLIEAEKMVDKILMLKPFRARRPRALTNHHASGVMAWNGDFGYILNNFARKDMKLRGDQIYIEKKLIENGANLGYVDGVLDNIYSYRWHCRREIPNNTTICCFHGTPRPRKVGYPFWFNRKYTSKWATLLAEDVKRLDTETTKMYKSRRVHNMATFDDFDNTGTNRVQPVAFDAPLTPRTEAPIPDVFAPRQPTATPNQGFTLPLEMFCNNSALELLSQRRKVRLLLALPFLPESFLGFKPHPVVKLQYQHHKRLAHRLA